MATPTASGPRAGRRASHRYQRRADVLNRGYSGYTSRWLLAAPSAAAVPHAKVLLTVIWLGANGGAEKRLEPRALDEFSENLAALVAKARDRSDDVVVVSCPPVDDRAYFDKAFSKKHPAASFRGVDRLGGAASLRHLPWHNVLDDRVLACDRTTPPACARDG
ncbi:hypothetical protein JL720_17153 [Aureococcus anophagefferens]|nr:hypothetical protein JL720_17153 [Aureococcus anophagefferens]